MDWEAMARKLRLEIVESQRVVELLRATRAATLREVAALVRSRISGCAIPDDVDLTHRDLAAELEAMAENATGPEVGAPEPVRERNENEMTNCERRCEKPE